ncbi:MAG: glutamyl-tRNA reductase [Planctomycetota bacterium]|nr:glutamyl-tRNA reductase [Planctomycetota bacterium]
MELFVFGLNHRTAPVEVRERWALSEGESRRRLLRIRDKITPAEHAILSTCNRTEFYSRVPRARSPLGDTGDANAQRSALARFYGDEDHVTRSDLSHFYVHREDAAVEHLFRLAGGLDSMIVGESEILRQIKAAYHLSLETRTAGSLFHRLFPAALKAGKRVRTLTDISKGCITPGQAALALARQVLGDLSRQSVLLVGSGKIATLTARAVLEAGIDNFSVINRHRERAQQLVEKLQGGEHRESPRVSILEWDELPEALRSADLVVSSTSSPAPLVDAALMRRIQEQRGHRPFVAVDLAIPRDFDPAAGAVDGVVLYNIDHLNGVVQANIDERMSHLPKAEDILRQQVDVFVGQMSYFLEVDPVIRHLVERFEAFRLGELQAHIDQFPPETHAALHEMTRSLANKLLHFPISRLKALRNKGGLSELEVEFLKKLFSPDP